jgi:hypothetical protein
MARCGASTKQPFKAVLDHDMKALAVSGEKDLLEIIAATHTGITVDDFSKIVPEWIATAHHPRLISNLSIRRCWS